MTTQNRILVPVDGTDKDDYMMERAIEHAALDGATLVIAHVMPEKLYRARQTALASVSNLAHDGTRYTIDVARAEALAIASHVAKAALRDAMVEYVAVGAVGTLSQTLPALAAEHNCETMILAAERSWWRRRLGWGDRKLAREFAGHVLRVPPNKPSLLGPDPLALEG